MADTIALEVTRYCPDQEAEPTSQRFEVPFREDWVVLDALNYIKDKLDGSLSYRWSCRMGVCGSCGVMVNGEPKLTCATFLSHYMPGPVRVEPLRYFPVVRDLAIEMTDFMVKLQGVQPWIIREEEKPLSAGEYLQTPEALDTYSSACASTACCAMPPARFMGWIPSSSGRRPLPWRSATTWIPATRECSSASVFSLSMRAFGAAPSPVSARRSAPRVWIRLEPYSNTS